MKREKICRICGKSIEKTLKHCYVCSEKCLKKFQSNTRLSADIYSSRKNYPDGSEYVECKECGYRGPSIHRHIKAYHHIMPDEYCEKYGLMKTDLMTASFRKHISDGQKKSYSNGKRTGFTSINNPSKGIECKLGRNSPYSMNFRGYDGLSNEDKTKKIKELKEFMARKKMDNGNNPLTIEYYLKRGYSEDEAKNILKKRQTTFTLEKCLEKYGKEKGYEVWEERQKKWLSNYKKLNYSKVSQELFWKVFNKLDNKKNIYFATLDKITGGRDDSGSNHECLIHLSDCYIKPDFIDIEQKKIIEFDGDYWHGIKVGMEKKDKEREEKLLLEGYKILRVKEHKFYENPDRIIDECLNFLKK